MEAAHKEHASLSRCQPTETSAAAYKQHQSASRLAKQDFSSAHQQEHQEHQEHPRSALEQDGELEQLGNMSSI